jgi:hypothetical protein
VIRFHGNGLPDATFGPHSTGVATGFGGCSWAAGCFEKAEATSLVLQSNGKIIVAGSAKRLGAGFMDDDAALVRFLQDGSRDSSGFGTDGYVLTDGGGNRAQAKSVKIAGGGLFVAGWAFSPEQAMMARYSLSDSALDGGFGVIVGSACQPQHKTAALTLVVQSFPCRGTICVPTHKLVIAGPCISHL